MMNRQRIMMFVGAHPDDESFGVGGTLAKYAAAGVDVYYVCGTRGDVGDASASLLQGFATVADLRCYELECAAQILGIKEVIHLGYRDSGMPGTEDNNHPQALAAAPLEEVAGKIVREIRRLKPEVVITFDPIGGYRHPDHLAIHNAVVMAFEASGDAGKYPEAGPPYRSQKLYFHVMPHGWMKFMVGLLKIIGRDPRHFGRNKDIDLTETLKVEYPVHAVVKLNRDNVRTRDRAATCHASQLMHGSLSHGLYGFIGKLSGQKDKYMREYPKADEKEKESDLFEGIMDTV